MKPLPALQAWIDRVDALSLRERGMIFLAICVVIVGLADTLVFDPMLKRQQALSQKISQQQDEIRAMQSQIETMARAKVSESAAGKAQQLARLQAQLAALDRELEARQRELIPPERMVAFLENLLKRNRGVQLVSLQTTAPTPLSGGAGATMYRHGLQVELRGGYFDLMRYLEDLERQPAKVFWGDLELDASAWPSLVLKFSISTLSADRTWLVI